MELKKSLLTLFVIIILGQKGCILKAMNADSYTIARARVSGVQIPIKMVHKKLSVEQCATECASSLLMHGLLEYTSPSTSISECLLKHGKLWACHQAIGLLGAAAHELGHAIVAQQHGHRANHIGVFYNNTAFLCGAYDSEACIEPKIMVAPGRRISKDTFQTTKKDACNYLKEFNQWHAGIMQYSLAGPVVGITTSMSLFFAARKLVPSLFESNFFLGVSVFSLLAQNAMALNPYIEDMDAHKAVQAYRSIKKNEKLEEQLTHFSDDDRVEVDQLYNEIRNVNA